MSQDGFIAGKNDNIDFLTASLNFSMKQLQNLS